MTRPDALSIVEVFAAPRELVFRNWIEPDQVSVWFAPDGFTVTHCEIDARPGGRWRVEYRSDADDGAAYVESGEFQEVVYPERLVFTLTRADGGGRVREATSVTVTFTEKGAGTEVAFHQSGFDSTRARDGEVEGWNECFRKLDRHLGRRGG